MFDIKISNNINEIVYNIDEKEQKVKLAAIKALNNPSCGLESSEKARKIG